MNKHSYSLTTPSSEKKSAIQTKTMNGLISLIAHSRDIFEKGNDLIFFSFKRLEIYYTIMCIYFYHSSKSNII